MQLPYFPIHQLFPLYYFSAKEMGIKDTVPAYLDPTLTPQDLLTGVTFASGGTGYDPMTPKLAV